ncbi:hypothetical protein FACS189434_04340 [Bacteroidia bacterium]|nr:hypothetical protein FACS189434_04340 [Bacteroidia bacterium]
MKQQMKQKLKNNVIVIALILAIPLLCVAQKTTIKTPNVPAKECIKKILANGDIEAYKNLMFFSHASSGDYLIYSLFMANHYNYPDAYAFVYNYLTELYNKNNIDIDEQTFNLALEYLQKGVDLGSSNAQIRMSELYINGKYFPQDSIKGFDLYVKGWHMTDSIDIERSLKHLRIEYQKAAEKIEQKK